MTHRARCLTAAVFLISSMLITCREDDRSPAEPTLSSDGPRLQVESDKCPGCVVDQTFVRGSATPITETVTFEGHAQAHYIIDIDDLGSQGADGTVTLNGQLLLAPRLEAEMGRRHLRVAVALHDQNVLLVRLTGKRESLLRVKILGGARVVGPDGGEVVMPAGFARVVVPPGALLEEVEIHLTPAPDIDLSALIEQAAPAIQLEPAGLVFAQPVTVAFRP